MNYYQLEKEINNLWKQGISYDGTHVFFKDIDLTIQDLNNYRRKMADEYNIKSYPTNIQMCTSSLLQNYPKIKGIEERRVKWEKPLTSKDIMEINNYLQKEPDRYEILKTIKNIKNKPLPSNINLSSHLKWLKTNAYKNKNRNKNKNKTKKFLVMGAGPNGLFISILLNHIYNMTSNGIENDEFADILMIDNRITEEGFRQPYTRTRDFAYNSIILTFLYKYLFCKNPFPGGPINYIEYLGYIKAFSMNIPMYFTKKYEDEKSIKQLIDKIGFDVLFDCTGGKLKIHEMNSIKIPYSLDKNLPLKRNNFILKRKNGDNNEIILQSSVKNNPYLNMFYLELYDKDKETTGEYRDLSTLYTCDILLYFNYSNGLMTKQQMEKIIPYIKDPIDSVKVKLTLDKKPHYVKYFKFQPIDIKMHHLIKIAKVINIDKNKKCLYIASGDTLFHSHFITGAGINRLFNFITRILYKF